MPGGKASKIKGAKYEREVAEIFRKRSGVQEIKRGIGQARSAHEVADVEGVPGWWIECKHGVNTTPKRALRQAERALKASGIQGKRPVAVCKDNHDPAVVCLYLEDFLDIIYPHSAASLPTPEEFVINYLAEANAPVHPMNLLEKAIETGLVVKDVKAAYLRLFDEGKVAINDWKLTLVKNEQV